MVLSFALTSAVSFTKLDTKFTEHISGKNTIHKTVTDIERLNMIPLIVKKIEKTTDEVESIDVMKTKIENLTKCVDILKKKI